MKTYLDCVIQFLEFEFAISNLQYTSLKATLPRHELMVLMRLQISFRFLCVLSTDLEHTNTAQNLHETALESERSKNELQSASQTSFINATR